MAKTNELLRLRQAIEYTLLKPDITSEQILVLCRLARDNNFPAVCIPSYFIEEALGCLEGSETEIVTVVGFPFGYDPLLSKFETAEDAFSRGANHIDVVINISAVRNNDWELVDNEIATLTRLAHREEKVIKFICETGLLTEIEIDLLCKIANEHKPDYIKTSTGINGAGAAVEIIQDLRELLDTSIKIKASGGIKTYAFAIDLLTAGADRIGTSQAIEIISEGIV